MGRGERRNHPPSLPTVVVRQKKSTAMFLRFFVPCRFTAHPLFAAAVSQGRKVFSVRRKPARGNPLSSSKIMSKAEAGGHQPLKDKGRGNAPLL